LVLVAGATGVLGRALVPALRAAGHEVRGIARRPAGPDIHAADLLSSDLDEVLGGCDAVIHAATEIPRDAGAPNAWAANTALRTTGTRRLLAAAQAVGVRRYLQQSITMAYADGGDAWLDESAGFDASPSRASTVAPVQEMESLVQSSSLAWTILRGGQFVGPGTAQDAVIAALKGGRLTVPCDGRYWISPIHPADLASAMVAALTTGATAIFNITSEPVRYADYIDQLCKLVHAPAAARDLERACPPSQRCSTAHAQTLLGWRPSHSIYPEPH
jgi:nucleoside-diphosphate-sugar epimerase